MTSLEKSEAISATTHLPHPKYRADIDGLRAIAVLAVVIFHAFPSKLRGGFVGVDIFFVISGFLISSIIIGGLERGTFSFAEFYSRRVNRIFPALIAVLAAVWAFSWFGLFPTELEQLGKHMAGGATFISNFMLLGEAGYFDSSAETKVLLHLWSLGVEEQFYLVWPVILWLAWKIRFSIPATIIIFMTASFALNIYSVNINPAEAFYSPQTRFWELLIGASLAYFSSHGGGSHPAASTKLKSIISVIASILILLSVKYISKKYLFPGWWALIPAISAAAIIYAGPHAWINRKILSSRVMVFIGLISFPLYLWHWPLLALARVINGDEPSVEIRLAMIALAAVLAWLTYRLIEIPLRRRPGKHTQTFVLLVLMCVVGVIGFSTMKTEGFPGRNGVKQVNAITAELSGPSWKYQKNDICVSRYGQPPDVESYLWTFCYATKNESPEIILIGNSYANHLLPGLEKNQHTSHNSILSIGACSPEIKPNDSKPVKNLPCTGRRIEDQQKLIDAAINSLAGPKLVIISGLEHKTNSEFIEETSKKISAYEKAGATIVVFKPHILMSYDIKSCYGRPFMSAKHNCIIDKSTIDEYEEGFSPFVKQIHMGHPNVKFFDTNELFCSTGKCSFMLNGLPLVRDEFSHFSEFGSYELSKLFVEWAKTNAPGILDR